MTKLLTDVITNEQIRFIRFPTFIASLRLIHKIKFNVRYSYLFTIKLIQLLTSLIIPAWHMPNITSCHSHLLLQFHTRFPIIQLWYRWAKHVSYNIALPCSSRCSCLRHTSNFPQYVEGSNWSTQQTYHSTRKCHWKSVGVHIFPITFHCCPLHRTFHSTTRVMINKDWLEPLVLWNVVLADKGQKKSPTLNRFVKPIQQLEVDLNDADDAERVVGLYDDSRFPCCMNN